MSFGVPVPTPCPVCQYPLIIVDYEQWPPPIPPPRSGRYSDYNVWISDNSDGRSLVECPGCDEELPHPESVPVESPASL